MLFWKKSKIHLGLPMVLAVAFCAHSLLAEPQWAFAAPSCNEKNTHDLLRDVFPSKSIPWNKKIVFAQTETVLREGRIISIRPLKEAQEEVGKKLGGTHAVYKLKYEDGTEAIWKPSEWGSADAEVNAYRAARLVKSRQVPPTVKRTFSAANVDLKSIDPLVWNEVLGKEGSAQYYVKSPFDLVAKDEASLAAIKLISPKEKSDQNIFYFVFGQWDAHVGNMIIDDSYHLALIDNTAIRDRLKVKYGSSPFRSNLALKKSAQVASEKEASNFPFQEAVILKHPSKEDFMRFLSDRVDQEKVDRFWKWQENKKDRTMAVITWHNQVWVQGIGFQNYDVSSKVFSKETLARYRELTFKNLRESLSSSMPDEQLVEILERRDQVLKASENMPLIP